MELSDMLERSRALAIQLKEIRKEEMDLRVEIASILGKDKLPGVHKFEIDGMKVKLVLKNNTSLDQEETRQALEDDRLTQDEIDLIRFKYELKMRDFKAADCETDNLEELIVVKPAAPTLEITLGED